MGHYDKYNVEDWSDYIIEFKDGHKEYWPWYNISDYMIANLIFERVSVIRSIPKNYIINNCYGRSHHRVLYKVEGRDIIEVNREKVQIIEPEPFEIELERRRQREEYNRQEMIKELEALQNKGIQLELYFGGE